MEVCAHNDGSSLKAINKYLASKNFGRNLCLLGSEFNNQCVVNSGLS
jgi:hypothetical protein